MKTDPDSDPLDKLPLVLRQNVDRNLCTCMDVPTMDVINAIINGATTVEAVKKETSATMGAGCCEQQVERLIECLCTPEPRRRRRRTNNTKTTGVD